MSRPIFFIPKLLILFCTLSVLSACGGPEKSIKRGDAALALGEYCEAAGQYRRAYMRTPNKEREKRGTIALKMGEAFRRYGNVARAAGAYRNAVRYGYTDTITCLRLGEMLLMQNDYKGAEKAFSDYLEKFPGDSTALLGLLSCRIAPEMKQRGSAYTVKAMPLFNGTRSDYAPAFMGQEAKQIYFTTTRQQVTGDEISGITGMKNGDIFFSSLDEKGKWKAPEQVKGVNTDFDEGACAFSADGKTMYLTVCRTDPQYPRMAEIWTSDRADAAWGKPEALKITADTLSSYAHPAPSPDGRWLYFTSDMPGGMGGLDLYRATEDTVRHMWKVEHLPAPMNSFADDFGITFEGLHNRGFFSSNRTTGGRGWDKIFEFSYPEVLQTVKGWVYEQDGYELPDAVVYMVGSDGTNQKLSVLSDGSFEQAVQPGVNYLFLATCRGYLNHATSLTADTAEVERQYVLQFPLPSIGIPVLVRNVFYEFDKADLTENSCEALDRLTKMLKENPNVTIELAAHCDYRGNDDYNLNLSQRRAESVVRYLTEHGIASDRLTPKGYGEEMPKVVNKKLTETYPFLHENDTLTLDYILKLTPEEQEICNALNRRTEFRVLRTTYGLFDEAGKLKPQALKPENQDSPENPDNPKDPENPENPEQLEEEIYIE